MPCSTKELGTAAGAGGTLNATRLRPHPAAISITRSKNEWEIQPPLRGDVHPARGRRAPASPLFRFRRNFRFEIGRDARKPLGNTAQALGSFGPLCRADLALGDLAQAFHLAIQF